jgi:GINS complex subunit 2
MSGRKLGYVSPQECEFIAEETLITVTSHVNHQPFRFISGTFGPMRAGFPCDLPLWLAVTLRKKNEVTFQVPQWMTLEWLKEEIEFEKNSSDVLGAVPFHYIEISQLLLQVAKEDIPNADEVSVLLQDLENIRMDRIKIGFRDLSSNVRTGNAAPLVMLSNLSAIELIACRPHMIKSLMTFDEIHSTFSAIKSGGATNNTTFASERPSSLRALAMNSSNRNSSVSNTSKGPAGAAADANDGQFSDYPSDSNNGDEESGERRTLRRFRT